MKPIFIHFYRAEDCLKTDSRQVDYERMARACPVGSIPGRAAVLFKMHLKHLGFWISWCKPELEGLSLDVELMFLGKDRGLKRPVLAAFHGATLAAQLPISLDTLDISPFLSALLKRKPDLKDEDLYFTVRTAP